MSSDDGGGCRGVTGNKQSLERVADTKVWWEENSRTGSPQISLSVGVGNLDFVLF